MVATQEKEEVRIDVDLDNNMEWEVETEPQPDYENEPVPEELYENDYYDDPGIQVGLRHKTQKWYYKYTVPVVLIIQIALAMLLLSGCGSGASYNQISQDEAVQMMQEQTDYLIVDVRRPDEYAEGHIPGAINVPNETIEDEQPDALPDKEQVLLIYCRSGNRSKEASQKLADMGYTNVYEFGGINTWEGEIDTGDQNADSEEPAIVTDYDGAPMEFDENGNPTGEYAQYLWEQQQLEDAKRSMIEEAMRDYYEEQERPEHSGFPF